MVSDQIAMYHKEIEDSLHFECSLDRRNGKARVSASVQPPGTTVDMKVMFVVDLVDRKFSMDYLYETAVKKLKERLDA